MLSCMCVALSAINTV